MTAWTDDELTRVGTAEELQIASRRRDGTLGSPRTNWVVPHGDDLYVRSVRGPGSDWFRGTQVRRERHIRAGGVGKDVAFADAAPEHQEAWTLAEIGPLVAVDGEAGRKVLKLGIRDLGDPAFGDEVRFDVGWQQLQFADQLGLGHGMLQPEREGIQGLISLSWGGVGPAPTWPPGRTDAQPTERCRSHFATPCIGRISSSPRCDQPGSTPNRAVR
jgi:hypothetical protein